MKLARIASAIVSVLAIAALIPILAFKVTASDEFVPEPAGQHATLDPLGERLVWVPDRLLQHNFLFDGDSGRMLGTIPSTSSLSPKLPLVSRARGEIYSVDLDYSRGMRGARTDYVTIYDAETFRVKGEVVLPHPTSESNTSLHHTTLLDDDRFLVVFSQFPATIATVVDVVSREIVAEVSIAGCAGVYAVGPTRFATLCGDGTTAVAVLGRDGAFERLEKSAPFFNVVEDAVSMAGVRLDRSWLFVSFAGVVHEIDYSSADGVPSAKAGWSLVDEDEREDGWRPGGLQPFALHRASKRLYALMHEGEAGSHKNPGPEIWTFDLDTKSRLDEFDVPNLTAEFLGDIMGAPAGSFALDLLRFLVPNPGAHALVVTQDAKPILFTRSSDVGLVAVLDGESGKRLRNLKEAGITGPTLGVP